MATRHRSPNYPSAGLGEAVKLLKKFYAEAKRTPVDELGAARAIGYGTLNGVSRTKLSILKKYGLFEEIDGKYRVSDRGLRIVVTSGPDDELAALREAALAPDLFREVHASHADASSSILISYLMRDKAFTEDGARSFDAAYRDTVKVAKLDDPAYISLGEKPTPEEKPPMTNQQMQQNPPPPTPPRTGALQRSFTTGTDTMDAVITITSHAGEITGEDIAFLKDYLEFMERSWSRRKPQQPATPVVPPASPDRVVTPDGRTATVDSSSMVASVPIMITKRMEAELRDAGYTSEEIGKMTPQQAHDNLKATKN